MSSFDEMEIGESGWVPEPNGWFRNKLTGERMDAEGRVYDRFGELVSDPGFEDEDYGAGS